MKEVVKLIGKNESSLVVLSAMAGTTNALIEIADYFARGNRESAAAMIGKLYTKQGADYLATTKERINEAKKWLKENKMEAVLIEA